MATFKGVCYCLKTSSPLCFILENVDSLETSDDDKESFCLLG